MRVWTEEMRDIPKEERSYPTAWNYLLTFAIT